VYHTVCHERTLSDSRKCWNTEEHTIQSSQRTTLSTVSPTWDGDLPKRLVTVDGRVSKHLSQLLDQVVRFVVSSSSRFRDSTRIPPPCHEPQRF
jgi:hypothetical protein